MEVSVAGAEGRKKRRRGQWGVVMGRDHRGTGSYHKVLNCLKGAEKRHDLT